MSLQSRILVGLVALAAAGAASAQGFPEGSSTPSVDELKKRLSGNVFNVKLADGISWRLEFNSSGYFFIDTSAGFKGTGEWTAEEGKFCAQLRGRPRSCNDVRVHQDILHLKRDSGEFIQYLPR